MLSNVVLESAPPLSRYSDNTVSGMGQAVSDTGQWRDYGPNRETETGFPAFRTVPPRLHIYYTM